MYLLQIRNIDIYKMSDDGFINDKHNITLIIGSRNVDAAMKKKMNHYKITSLSLSSR